MHYWSHLLSIQCTLIWRHNAIIIFIVGWAKLQQLDHHTAEQAGCSAGHGAGADSSRLLRQVQAGGGAHVPAHHHGNNKYFSCLQIFFLLPSAGCWRLTRLPRLMYELSRRRRRPRSAGGWEIRSTHFSLPVPHFSYWNQQGKRREGSILLWKCIFLASITFLQPELSIYLYLFYINEMMVKSVCCPQFLESIMGRGILTLSISLVKYRWALSIHFWWCNNYSASLQLVQTNAGKLQQNPWNSKQQTKGQEQAALGKEPQVRCEQGQTCKRCLTKTQLFIFTLGGCYISYWLLWLPSD